jgi:hypothetical protein
LACGAAVFAGLSAAEPPVQTKSASSRVERGKYLATILGCNDCHTPFKMRPQGPEPDMTRMLSGHPESMKLPPPPAASGPWVWFGTGTNTAYAGPWGISYASNLTPDKNTGIGIWTEDMFLKAIKTSQAHGCVAGDPASHAVAVVRESNGRRLEGRLRLPPNDSADRQPRTRLAAAGSGQTRRRQARGA